MASSTPSSSKRELDADEKTLRTLLDEFSSIFPLEDIASAYCEAGRNAKLTAEILYRMQGSNNVGEVYTSQEEMSEITSESSNCSGNFEPSSRIQSSPDSIRGFPKGVRPAQSDMRWVVKQSAKNACPDTDVSQLEEYEEFLFKMLQHGFRVDRDVIRQVLRECGCDMKKSLAKLIDLAADNHNSKYELNEGNVPDRYQTVGAERASLVSRNENEESEIKRLILPQCDNEEQDGDYYILRQAVKEYRSTMNEYYKAATEAFSNGDHARSITLLEKGTFFYRKAREADEESAKRIFSSSMDEEEEEVIPLNLEKCMPKEAVRLVKSHLRNFSGIASVKYLRISNGGDEEDAVRRCSRIRLVIKLLQSECIDWREEEDSGAILVSLEDIDPRRLSFAHHLA